MYPKALRSADVKGEGFDFYKTYMEVVETSPTTVIRDLLEIKSDRAQLELSGIRRRQGRSGHELPTVDLKLPHHRRTGYNLPKRADSEVNFRAYFTQEFSAVAAR